MTTKIYNVNKREIASEFRIFQFWRLLHLSNMSHYITNETIKISNYYGQTENHNDLIIHVINADNDVHLALIDAPEEEQWLGCGSMWLIFLISSYFRYILYDYLFEQYQLNQLKPISVLILLVAVLDHVQLFLNAIYHTLITINNDSLEHVSGGLGFCTLIINMAAFTKIFSFVGGLMMAIYRILLVKQTNMVRNRIGEKNLLKIIFLVGMTVTVLMVELETLNDYQQLRRDRCVLSVPNMRSMAIILDEYGQSRGKPALYAYWRSMRIGLASALFVYMVAEFIIYAIFLHHMYQHNNSTDLRTLLQPEVITRRNRRNAITFFVQFCSFLVEFNWLVLFILISCMGSTQNGLFFIRHFLWSFSLAIIPIIEVLTSSVLRPRIIQLNIYDLIHGLN